MHYYRYDSPDGKTTAEGTKINVRRLVKIVKQAVEDVQTKPTCLNNATERTVGKFLADFPSTLNRLPQR